MSAQIHIGDCREVLKTLPAESVHCVVTSPPYWGLRDYGVDGQIGLELSPWEYLDTMVDIFRGVWRVLRKDGTIWVNMGDSYSQGGNGGHQQSTSFHGHKKRAGDRERIPKKHPPGMKPKNLMGIPWRLALALQDDGWYLRQDIIWAKPNPMPESVRDRCTKAHEYIFLLSKSEKYYYDFDAMQEPVNGGAHPRRPDNGVGFGHGTDKATRHRDRYRRNPVGGCDTGPGRHSTIDHNRDRNARKLAAAGSGTKNNTSMDEALAVMPKTRNRRSVWTIPTAPFSGAHFATFPPGLVEPCILAGCPRGGVVLDIFGGAGTTGLVAERLQRDSILIELNPEYAAMAERRISGDAPMLAGVQVIA